MLQINLPTNPIRSFKKFLNSTPVQFNGKPLKTWKLLLPIAILLIIPLLTFSAKQLIPPPPTPDQIAQAKYEKAKTQADTLSQKVAKQADIPTDETPNVATITDVNALQDQAFFKVAKNGDKILIYEKKKIIVLYRPSEDKVIATAPVLYNQPETAVAGTSSAATQPAASNSAQ